jgi:hypothetical protein
MIRAYINQLKREQVASATQRTIMVTPLHTLTQSAAATGSPIDNADRMCAGINTVTRGTPQMPVLNSVAARQTGESMGQMKGTSSTTPKASCTIE